MGRHWPSSGHVPTALPCEDRLHAALPWVVLCCEFIVMHESRKRAAPFSGAGMCCLSMRSTRVPRLLPCAPTGADLSLDLSDVALPHLWFLCGLFLSPFGYLLLHHKPRQSSVAAIAGVFSARSCTVLLELIGYLLCWSSSCVVAHRPWHCQTFLRGSPSMGTASCLCLVLAEANHRCSLVLGEEHHTGCCSLVAVEQQGLGGLSPHQSTSQDLLDLGTLAMSPQPSTPFPVPIHIALP